MKNQDSNRRKNIRFKTRVPEVIRLLFDINQYEETPIHAIKIDENIRCVSCIIVSPFDLSEGMKLIYIESDEYKNPSVILRVEKIEETVYKLVFEMEGVGI